MWRGWIAGLAAMWPGAACGEEARPGDHDILVYGRALPQIGQALSATQGVIGYEDFRDRPLSRVGELVETVPGVIATQHSGTGKANQYFLRGFNLDHGTGRLRRRRADQHAQPRPWAGLSGP